MPDFVKDNHLFHNPVEYAINKIGGTYKMPILWRLKDKKWRFSELQKSLTHSSDRMLSKSLKELIIDGFVTKEIIPEVPVKTLYSITDKGKRSITIIITLREYGFELMKEDGVDYIE